MSKLNTNELDACENANTQASRGPLGVRVYNWLTHRTHALAIILLVTVITHLPSGFGSFIADDHMQWAMLKGSPILQDLGFGKAATDKSVGQGLLDGFHFFSDQQSPGESQSTLDTYRNYGNMPWWSGENISMVPFRPLAALTHWVDYSLFGDTLWLHQCHSLLYLLILAVLVNALYRQLAGHAASDMPSSQQAMLVATLATLLMMVDFSMTRSFTWVVARNSYLACAIGVASLLCFIRWREQARAGWLLLSMALFGAALLTAEAALSVAAYMGAYVLCLERQPLYRKALTLVPVVTVIVLWRIGYSDAGFGALNIAQYIDPVQSPGQFISNFLSVFPMIVFNQIVGLDSLIIFVHPHSQWMLVVLAWAVLLGSTYLIRSFLRSSAVDRFWFIGSIVAAIPGTALISAESRTMTFVAIGFFYLLAKWIMRLYQQREHWLPRWVSRGLVSWHLVFPLLLSWLLTSGLAGYSQLPRQPESVVADIESGKTGLVVVNPEMSGMMYYLPFEWAFRNLPVPGRLNVLTSGLESSELTRISEREFLISAPAGMPLTHNAPIRSLSGAAPAISALYTSMYTHSFFTTPAQRLRVGERILNADMRVTVLKVNDVGPTRLRIEFIGEESPDQKVWQWYDWERREFRRLEPLAIQETRRFPGPMDIGKPL